MDRDVPVASLGGKVVRGAAWLASARVLSRGLGAVQLVILASLVSPRDLGTFGLAALVLSLVDVMSNTGLRQALIQRGGDVQAYLATAWVSQIVRGVAIAAVVILSSTFVESYFDCPGLAVLLIVLSPVPLLLGIQNIGTVLLHRELDFRKLVLLDLAVAIVEFTVCIGVALVYPSVWALAAGRLSAAACALAASFLIERRHAGLDFSARLFKELYRFGFWVFCSAVLSFALVRGGDFAVAKLLTVESLAVYQIAYALACLPLIECLRAIGSVTFAAYSRLQDDRARLEAAFLRVFLLAANLSFLFIAAVFLTASDVTLSLFDARYSELAVLLPPLSIWGACRALGASNSTLFQAAGFPSLATVFQAVMSVMFAALIVPMANQGGTLGVARALVIIGVSAQCMRYVLLVWKLQFSGRAIAARLAAPAATAAVSLLIASLVMAAVRTGLPGIDALLGVGLIGVLYLAIALAVDRWAGFGMTEFVRGLVAQRRSDQGLSQVTSCDP